MNQDSPEWIWNAQYRKVFGASTFLEAKFTGYWGYYDLTPIDTSPWHEDWDTGAITGGGATADKYDRTRNQLNLSLTRYASMAGQHAFKFGAEIERSYIRDRYVIASPVGVWFYDYSLGGGVPYAVSYGYDLEGKNNRISAYAQDQWKIGNQLTLNAGVRLDDIKGYSTKLKKDLYKTTSVSPRFGLAWDLTGRGTSVARAYYGVLYEGANFSTWSWAAPGASDYVYYTVPSYNVVGVEYDRIPAENKYTVASSLKHPRTDEFNVSFEQQFMREYKVSATFIRRDYKNFLGPVFPTATWTPVNFTVPSAASGQSAIAPAGTTMTVYRWANRASIDQKFIVDNIDDFQYFDPGGNKLGDINGYRNYTGVMLVLARALKDRWQGQLSYVWSKTKGTMNNDGSEGGWSSRFVTPNSALINKDGPASYDRTHEFKVYLGYQIPVAEVMLGGYLRGVSGLPYSAYAVASSSVLNYSSSVNVNIEPKNSRRNDFSTTFDLRAEKVFQYGIHRFGVYVDATNLLNTMVVTGRQTRWPSTTISGSVVKFGDPTGLSAGRQVTFGGRWSF